MFLRRKAVVHLQQFETPPGERQVNGAPRGNAEWCTTAARVTQNILAYSLYWAVSSFCVQVRELTQKPC